VTAGNNTIVQRTGSGYIFANYFNTSPNDVANGYISKMLVESNNDGYMRHATASTVRDFLGVENLAAADQTQADINNLQITKLGTLTAGTWNAGVIADGYLSTNTAHLSGTQTFTGSKTFTGSTTEINNLEIQGNTALSSGNWDTEIPANNKYYYVQWSMRWYMRYGYAYYPSTSYGPSYYQWSKYSVTPITSWQDSWNVGYMVPETGTFKGAVLIGSTTNTETLQLKILKGTPSSNSNSSTSISLSSMYSPSAASFTSGRRKSMGSLAGANASVTQGDIIVPQLNKTTNINQTTRYLYGTLILKFRRNV
jgi:hypothetical protein